MKSDLAIATLIRSRMGAATEKVISLSGSQSRWSCWTLEDIYDFSNKTRCLTMCWPPLPRKRLLFGAMQTKFGKHILVASFSRRAAKQPFPAVDLNVAEGWRAGFAQAA